MHLKYAKNGRDYGGALGAVPAQCKRNPTIWACGCTRDPYFVILGGHHCCLRVGFDTSSTLAQEWWLLQALQCGTTCTIVQHLPARYK